MNISLSIEGLGTLRKLLSRPEETLYGPPWAEGMQRLGERGNALAHSGAPVYNGTPSKWVRPGQLRDSIRFKVQPRAFPQWVSFSVPARAKFSGRRGGFPYPRLLPQQ